MRLTKGQLKRIIREEKRRLDEMAKGPADGYGGYEYMEDKSQFNDDHSALHTPLGHASNMADVGGDLFSELMHIFREAFAKGMSAESIAATARDAARDFQA